ncbi:LAME_0G19284g1_1 [Lachancea meyersii CBS 8951]|uniref:LAME_0G19284g1_1 n=1 Tax=Lachancea meyersii CBS 8951 TaxID=1266667 RepID=A0A1G4KC36_9SACH|nr:LAME_0G19284g1_1 [Lachancea meyersii CBS 8951]
MSLVTQGHDLDASVDYLVSILHKPGFSGKIQHILSNLVYYVPRLRTHRKLEQLVVAMLESAIWPVAIDGDWIILQETAEAIFSWKLEISEPVIDVAEFYEVWDRAIRNCRAWTVAKLTIIAGILNTRTKFEDLQTRFFLDAPSSVSRKYLDWKYKFFMPLWQQLFTVSLRNAPIEAEHLAVFMSQLFEIRDVKKISGDLLAPVLLHLSLAYVKGPNASPRFVSKNLGSIAKTLEATLPNVDVGLANETLNSVCATAFDISLREMHAPKANYSSQTHSNQLLTVVLILRGCLLRSKTPRGWYNQAIISLFYMDFIAQDFGKAGFQSYEYIYNVSSAACTIGIAQYYCCLSVMRGNIWPSHESNVVNTSRILFLLNFLESSLGLVPIAPDFLDDYVVPVLSRYGASSNTSICEAAQAAQLCLYSNNSSGKFLQVWKAAHYQDFLQQSIHQYLGGVLSSSQLVHIFAAISQDIPLLSQANPDISREILHYTYLRILNCRDEHPEVISTLILCLIKQLSHIQSNYTTDWLENCVELIQLCPSQKEKVLDGLWKQITSSRLPDDRALNWFLNNQSKL